MVIVGGDRGKGEDPCRSTYAGRAGVLRHVTNPPVALCPLNHPDTCKIMVNSDNQTCVRVSGEAKGHNRKWPLGSSGTQRTVTHPGVRGHI